MLPYVFVSYQLPVSVSKLCSIVHAHRSHDRCVYRCPVVIFCFCLVSVLSGIGLPLQAAINKSLTTIVQTRIRSSLVSFCLGAVITGVAVLVIQFFVAPLSFSGLGVGNMWMWLGGPVSVMYMLSTIYFPPLVGLSLFFMLLIAGQLTASLILDDVGAFGLPVIPASAQRIAAVCLACAGCVCVQIDVVDKAEVFFCERCNKNKRSRAATKKESHAVQHVDACVCVSYRSAMARSNECVDMLALTDAARVAPTIAHTNGTAAQLEMKMTSALDVASTSAFPGGLSAADERNHSAALALNTSHGVEASALSDVAVMYSILDEDDHQMRAVPRARDLREDQAERVGAGERSSSSHPESDTDREKAEAAVAAGGLGCAFGNAPLQRARDDSNSRSRDALCLLTNTSRSSGTSSSHDQSSLPQDSFLPRRRTSFENHTER